MGLAIVDASADRLGRETSDMTGRYVQPMILDFVHLDRSGEVSVEVDANTAPHDLGGDESNLGFPTCTATVRYRGGGYLAMMGWVQLVRSTDAESREFEMDPYFLFPDVDSPYAFYGHAPTLFDGPGRTHRNDTDWLAHTFLAATPIQYRARLVKPLAGFSWGFHIRRGQVEVVPASPLPATAWAEHCPFLKAKYPNWHFETASVPY
jgi:hypothetical protein